MRLTLTPIMDRLRPNRAKTESSRRNRLQANKLRARPPKPSYALPARPPEPIHVKRADEASRQGPVADATKASTEVTRNKYVARVLAVLDIAGTGRRRPVRGRPCLRHDVRAHPARAAAGRRARLADRGPDSARSRCSSSWSATSRPWPTSSRPRSNGLVAARGALSVIGLVGLLWGASAFYGRPRRGHAADIRRRRRARPDRPADARHRHRRRVIVVLIVGTVLLERRVGRPRMSSSATRTIWRTWCRC